MFRSNLIGCINSFLHGISHQKISELIQRFLNDLPAFQLFYEAFYFLVYLFCQRSAGGNQDGGCQFIPCSA